MAGPAYTGPLYSSAFPCGEHVAAREGLPRSLHGPPSGEWPGPTAQPSLRHERRAFPSRQGPAVPVPACSRGSPAALALALALVHSFESEALVPSGVPVSSLSSFLPGALSSGRSSPESLSREVEEHWSLTSPTSDKLGGLHWNCPRARAWSGGPGTRDLTAS